MPVAADCCCKIRQGCPAWAVMFCLTVANGLLAAEAPRKTPEGKLRTGQEIYRQQCAACHGTSGEGTPENCPRPLAGNRSPGQLAGFIEKSMPEDKPGTCIGEDARAVAGFIYDAFYSPAARARNKPARIELSRLTVNQYANVVADLAGSFRKGVPHDGPPGLRAKYIGRWREKDVVKEDPPVEQIDPRVDFVPEGPFKGQRKRDEYEIFWRGALFAPETGEYEFNLDTSNGGRLWLNDNRRPLIDAWVRSGMKTDHRESIRLLGGRKYPIHVDYSKGQKEPAHIALKWKLPQGAEEVVPARCLSTDEPAETLVLQTPFPPDDRSAGYERGTSISKEWERAVTAAAIEAAGSVGTYFRQLPDLAKESPGQDGQTRAFCQRFVERAIRHPLTEQQRQVYIDRRFRNVPDLETAVRRVVMLTLVSPRFLYVANGGDAFDTATRLSLAMWDSLPDQRLIEAASAGRLATREQIGAEAQRMLADPRCHAKLRLFFLQWLKVERPPDLAKDPNAFRTFDAATANDLRTSLLLFLDDVMWSKESDFRQLLTAEFVYMNGRLAGYYRQDLPPAADFQKVVFERQQRAGVLSHPYLMAAFAHTAASSPIHRGVFLARGVLGLALRPPPMAIAPLSPDLQPTMTTRERVELQTRAEACQTCHATINPLGFALERFDASGRLRQEEKGRPIDASGSYVTRDGRLVKFRGACDLAQFLAASDEVHRAFVEHLFQYLAKQPVRAYGPKALSVLTDRFAIDRYNMQDLVVEIAVMAAKQP